MVSCGRSSAADQFLPPAGESDRRRFAAAFGERRSGSRYELDPLGSLEVLKLTWSQVAAWRVRRHHLDQRAPAGRMLAVASRLCGLHAQLMSSAELTVWARVENLGRGAVQRALWEDRALVKSWAMRGTLHLLPARELSLWYAALGASPRYLRSAAWEKYFGITLEELDQLTEASRPRWTVAFCPET